MLAEERSSQFTCYVRSKVRPKRLRNSLGERSASASFLLHGRTLINEHGWGAGRRLSRKEKIALWCMRADAFTRVKRENFSKTFFFVILLFFHPGPCVVRAFCAVGTSHHPNFLPFSTFRPRSSRQAEKISINVPFPSKKEVSVEKKKNGCERQLRIPFGMRCILRFTE